MAQHGAGNTQPLLLSAGDIHAALFKHRVIPIGKRHDKIVRLSVLGGTNHLLFGGVFITPEQVFAYCPAEENVFLQHHADALAERFDRVPAYIQPVYLDASFAHVVKTGDEIHKRGLAGAGCANDRDKLSRLDRQVDVFENIVSGACLIAERYIFELYFAGRRRELVFGNRAVADVGLRFENFVDTLGAGGGSRKIQQTHGDHQNAHKHLRDVHIEGIQLAREHCAADDHVAAEPEYAERRAVEDDRHKRHHNDDAHGGVQPGVEQLAVGVCKLFLFMSGADIRLDNADGHEIFLHSGVQPVDLFLKYLEETAAHLHQQPRRNDQHRDGDGKYKRQPGVEHETDDQRGEKLYRRTHKNAQTQRHRLLQGAHVVCDARDERSGGKPVDAGEGKPLYLTEQSAAQIPSEALAGICCVLGGKHTAEHGNDRKNQHQNAVSQNGIHAAGAVDAVVNDVRHQKRQKQLADRFQNNQQRREDRILFKFAQIGKEFLNHTHSPPWI